MSFLRSLCIQPVNTPDSMVRPDLPQAAVIILIMPDNEPRLVMAQKASHMRKHAGEVVFPGGKLEAGETLLQAALRECREELGIASEAIDLVGRLSPRVTRHDVVVYPFVGLLNRPVSYHLDTSEMQAVFDVPLDFLRNPVNLQQESVMFLGEPKTVYFYQYGQYKIWGVTALMIKELTGL